jgi:hypothetical protein
MDALRFAYWLQGFSELHQEPPTPEQWKSIREHLQLVFKKETPPVVIPATPAVPDSQRMFPGGPMIATCSATGGRPSTATGGLPQ